VIVEIEPEEIATIAFPLKSSFETLFAVPTKNPSSNIDIPFTSVAGGSTNQ
jgi:hypothetical protein